MSQHNVLARLKRQSVDNGTICRTITDEQSEMIGKSLFASWYTQTASGNLRKFWIVSIGPRGGITWRCRGTL